MKESVINQKTFRELAVTIWEQLPLVSTVRKRFNGENLLVDPDHITDAAHLDLVIQPILFEFIRKELALTEPAILEFQLIFDDDLDGFAAHIQIRSNPVHMSPSSHVILFLMLPRTLHGINSSWSSNFWHLRSVSTSLESSGVVLDSRKGVFKEIRYVDTSESFLEQHCGYVPMHISLHSMHSNEFESND